MADRLTKQQQKDSISAAVNQPNSGVMEALRASFAAKPVEIPPPELNLGDSSADYERAKSVINKNNPSQIQDPMMELLKRRSQPKPEFKTEMSDQDAADTMKQFEPSELELKRKLLNNLNNQ